ncbi:hypothetical protein [Streptomyces sp. CB01881]|uniref:hypothetical protein n=1 Tax=Streptomyces sp. CB01881 TaxID=2078691 RepID=UPI000CDC578E|nr:hypothetical protein [Streptomyces sp. CB01881]AUY53766.1 hypothetical protein C2142_38640 [Streptomyces sp. CB01881]TYC68776.1 hypothetical protein EH183_38635 [Streptomyces sp. CB01881]
MYQFIKDIVTALISLLPTAMSRRDAAKMRSLGAAMFDVPVTGYAIVHRGEEIVADLEHIREAYIERESWWQHLAELRAQGSREPYPDSGRWVRLHRNLDCQRTTLEQLHLDMLEVWKVLTLIDPDAYGAVSFIAQGKVRRLTILEEIVDRLGRGHLDLEYEPRPGANSGQGRVRRPGLRLRAALEIRHPAPIIPLHPWDPATNPNIPQEAVERFYREVNDYLLRAQPQQELAALKESLDHLHARLGETFDVKDVLLELAPNRLRRRHGP